MDAGVFRRLLCGGYVVARDCYVDARVILEIAMMLIGSCYDDLGDLYAFPVPRDGCVFAMGGCYAVTRWLGCSRRLLGG